MNILLDDDDIIDDDAVDDSSDDAVDDSSDDDAADDADDADEGESDDDEGESDDDDDETLVTVSYAGIDYEVPKGLEKAVMQEADYTQKTQTLSAKTKDFDDKAAGAEASFANQRQQFSDAVAIAAIDKELSGYSDLDWQALLTADHENGTNYVPQLQLEQQQLTRARETANETLAENTRKLAAVNHDIMVKSAGKTRTALKAKYPDWSPELEESMAQFAIDAGVPERQMRTTTHQATLDLLYMAHKYHQQEQKRLTATRKGEKDLKTPVKAAKVKGRKQGQRQSLSKLENNPEAWRTMREKELAKKAASGG